MMQVDELQCKFPINCTNALYIVKVGLSITRMFVKTIVNKCMETIIPIIVNQITLGSIIWTDEHRLCQPLNFMVILKTWIYQQWKWFYCHFSIISRPKNLYNFIIFLSKKKIEYNLNLPIFETSSFKTLKLFF